MEKNKIKPSPRDSGRRLDVYLTEYFRGGYSRTYLQKLINDGNVLINGRLKKPDCKIRQDDEIEITIPPRRVSGIQPEHIPLDVIYEDKDLLVVNKPAGMVTHPGAGVKSGTLVNALLYHCKGLSGAGGALRPGIVHRLDKDTSGIMLAAKNDFTHRQLAKQFKDRKIERRYAALVEGVMQFDSDEINLPIGRHIKDREKMAVKFAGAKEAITRYKVIKRFSDSTLLEITPITGRTHQIRVHMKAVGHPIVGDKKYGAKNASAARQMLHSQWVKFFHPILKRHMEFSCKPPF